MLVSILLEQEYCYILFEINSLYLMFSAATCSMLEDWSGIDREKAKEYIISCQVIKLIINSLCLFLWLSTETM